MARSSWSHWFSRLPVARNRRARFESQVEVLETRWLLSVQPLYYSAMGVGNNVANPLYGSFATNLLRPSGTDYGDGISTLAGAGRPGARVISNTIAAQSDSELNDRHMSDMVYAFGQFIDHDLDLTPAANLLPLGLKGQSVPIDVPADDPTFTQPIPFVRAVATPFTGIVTPRQNPNLVTSFLDGSMIYGSDPVFAAALRAFFGGRLQTSSGNLLPINTLDLPIAVDIPGVDPKTLFLAGDVRANENAMLVSLQTLFVREHNYWADTLAVKHPFWTDEQLYQGARQIVIAEIQAITFNEFLPALLGADAIKPYTGYNPDVNAGIAADFSEAAFRIGHTLLNGNIDFFNNDGSESHAPLDVSATTDNPSVLRQAGTTIDKILKYLTADNAQEVDNHVVDAFRNFLFDPTNTAGFDLYAIDIQRGRDLGLSDYNTVRAAYGLPKVTGFSQITSDPTLKAALKSLYGRVKDIDLIVGGLSEDHVPGGSVGPLFTRIIADQFERLRDGDRFWYQQIFDGSDLQAIENTTLADIISRNTPVKNLQKDVFIFSTGTIGGRVFLDSNRNGRSDAGEQGAEGVIVQLLDENGTLLAHTRTAADGTYQFDDLQTATTYKVQVMKPASSGTTSLVQSVELVDNTGAGQFDVNFGLKTSWQADLSKFWSMLTQLFGQK